jgi:pSer/pThr/pTyr-binding forkhead associated (FHA) protein
LLPARRSRLELGRASGGTKELCHRVPGVVNLSEAKMARLIVTCDGVDFVTHELVSDVITIGSAPLNHIVIDNPAVSAQHAILARVADSYRLKDLHSTNGTQVNGVSITDAELKDGDKIRFGSVVAVFRGTLQTLMEQMSSSPAGPLILPMPAQTHRESPMATAQVSPPSSRKSTLIAVAIAVLMIVGGAGWYLGHKRDVAREKVSGSTQAERQIPIVNPTQDEAASKQPEPIATQPRREATNDLTVLPTKDVARAEPPQQEVGAKEEFPVSNSPRIAESSIAPAPNPLKHPTGVSGPSWMDRLQKGIEDFERAIKNLPTSLGLRTRRLAPPDVYFTLTYLSVRKKSGITGFEPGTQVVCVKDEGPVLLVKAGDLEFEAKRQYLTNDLDVAALAVRNDAEAQQAIASYIAQQQQAIDQRDHRRKMQPSDQH